MRSQDAYATGYFTYEPSFAVSYLNNGLDLTVNNVFDVNAENEQTHYQSGDLYYLDFTAAQTFGRATIGLIGNLTQQVGDDRHDGQTVGDGERAQHLLLGPELGYNFGRFQILARLLADVWTRNDVAYSIAHVGISASF